MKKMLAIERHLQRAVCLLIMAVAAACGGGGDDGSASGPALREPPDGPRGTFLEALNASGGAWENRTRYSPGHRHITPLVFDSLRKRAVLFGGWYAEPSAPSAQSWYFDTWEWDGKNWFRMSPMHMPSPRRGHSMAFDPIRGRTVLYGGEDAGGILRDTWEWDGADWTFVESGTGPPDGVIAWDGTRVMSAGTEGTWFLGGTGWTRMRIPSPPARTRHAMAYSGKHVVLFGGEFDLTIRGDTWIWDGQTWKEVITVNGPLPRFGHGMAWDGAQVVMFGGSAKSPMSDTWAWNGSGWTHLAPLAAPEARQGHGMSQDANGAVIFGGMLANNTITGDTWTWSPQILNWSQVSIPADAPPAGGGKAMAYTSGNGYSLLLAGDTTWAWDGARWTSLKTAHAPPGRTGYALASIPGTKTVVMFGGYTNTGTLNDMWTFNGADWSQIPIGVIEWPKPRFEHSMAWDGGRNVLVLFGGMTGPNGEALNDTWEWNGQMWIMKITAAPPAARSRAAMVYAEKAAKVLMYGGQSASGAGGIIFFSETWVWNGAAWALLDAVSPPARSGHVMGYDGVRQKAVMFGGFRPSSTGMGETNETWEWDGSRWAQVFPVGEIPAARYNAAGTFDQGRRRFVVFGGLGGYLAMRDTWEYHGFGGDCTDGKAQCDTFNCIDGTCCEVSRCPDAPRCRTNKCQPTTGLCLPGYAPITEPCSTGDPCIIDQHCDASGNCVGGTNICPDGGTPDAGHDGGAIDSGFDAGSPDAGLDGGRPDASVDGGVIDGGTQCGYYLQPCCPGYICYGANLYCNGAYCAMLPDGGTPDAGSDAGKPDAGPDGGNTDGGKPDAGFDAGTDAGKPDAGLDGGNVDGGKPDAGFDAGFDGGVADGGKPDAGKDAGFPDAGFDGGQADGAADDAAVDAGPDIDGGQADDASVDSGADDAGKADSGQKDAGPLPQDGGAADGGIIPVFITGCTCSSVGL